MGVKRSKTHSQLLSRRLKPPFGSPEDQHLGPGEWTSKPVSDGSSCTSNSVMPDWSADAAAFPGRPCASWMNQVERFFGLLTDQQIRRSMHRSTQDLEASITAYIDDRYADPKSFRWTKSADDNLACIERFMPPNRRCSVQM
jgi:hypothetical protein